MIEYMKSHGLIEVKNFREILHNNKIEPIGKKGYQVFVLDGRYYIHIVVPHFRILFMDTNSKHSKSYLHFYVFVLILLLFRFIYFLILKNIKDTKRLLDSRQLFLRTVMHELKTPIAKGKIVSELLDDDKQKNRLISIFDTLNFLINDFATVEKVVSKNYDLSKQQYPINQIIENSIDMLLLEKTENIELKNIDNKKIRIDLDLFSLALKNLIDNGLKYSSDKKIIIEKKENQLLFISKGKALKHPLESYFKAFHNDTSNKNHGMGLGLYIVNSILTIHSMQLDYFYKDEKNIFIIKPLN